MSARMGSCSWEFSWGSASGLADCGKRRSRKPDGVMWYPQPGAKNCPSHTASDRNPPTDHPAPCPCSTACCTGLWWLRAKQKLSAQLPCTSGKGNAKPYQLAYTYLTQDVHGQVHQPKNVALVPWVQHANVVGDVVGAALHPSQGGILKPDTQGSHQGPPQAPRPTLGSGGSNTNAALSLPCQPPRTPLSGPSRALVAP